MLLDITACVDVVVSARPSCLTSHTTRGTQDSKFVQLFVGIIWLEQLKSNYYLFTVILFVHVCVHVSECMDVLVYFKFNLTFLSLL